MSTSLQPYWSPSGRWVILVLGAAVLFLAVKLYADRSKSKFPLPPGPKGDPIIGNLRQVPAERSDVAFANWAKNFNSDIIYLSLVGQPIIVLNSVQSAIDLLDNKGSIYSDRPPFVVLEVLGFLHNIALYSDGPKFRKLRKPFGKFLSQGNSLPYRDMQLKHAGRLASDIEGAPDKWLCYLSRFATRVLFSMAFGIDVVEEDDQYFKLAEQMSWIVSHMGTNGITPLDIAPWLQYVPRWLGKFIPSIKFVHDHSPLIHDFHQVPFDELMRNHKSGILEPSFVGRLVEARETAEPNEQDDLKTYTDDELKGTGGALYAAGQDTTFSTETVFIMAMVLYPDVQARAKKEIDLVTGGHRLPTYEDWKLLPIVERIVNEVFRFHPPLVNGVPHKTCKDDVYRDMFIPKGKTMVIANAWAMGHDPDVYSDPSTFNPDRYLPVSEGGLNEPFPQGHFGFGRRICPGQYIGFASVWIVVATLLAKFDITPPKDAKGKDILPALEFSTGITSHPVPFDAVFTARM